MIYTYRCNQGECACLNIEFTVSKRASDIDTVEFCRACAHPAERLFRPGRPQIMNAGDGWNDHTYNPAFGKVISSKAQLRKEMAEAKARGNEMVEVGNEPFANIHRHAEATQAHKSKEGWRKVSRDLGLPED